MKLRPQILNSDVDMTEKLLLANLNLTDFFRVCFQCKPLSSALYKSVFLAIFEGVRNLAFSTSFPTFYIWTIWKYQKKYIKSKFQNNHVAFKWRFQQKWISTQRRAWRWDFIGPIWSQFKPVSFSLVLGQKCEIIWCSKQHFTCQVCTPTTSIILCLPRPNPCLVRLSRWQTEKFWYQFQSRNCGGTAWEHHQMYWIFQRYQCRE